MRQTLPVVPRRHAGGFTEQVEMLAREFRRSSSLRGEIQRLENKFRVRRRNNPSGGQAAERDLIDARHELSASRLTARASVPKLFSDEQCELPGEVPATRRVGPEHHTVELQAQPDGLAKLDIRDLGPIDQLQILCKPNDANLVAFLIASIPALLEAANSTQGEP